MRLKHKSRIVSVVLSTVMSLGTFGGFSNVSFAGPDVPTMVIFKTASGQTVGQPEPVAVWNYDEGENTYRENGEELSIISNEETAFAGKKPRPEDAHKLKVTKSIPVKDIASYFETKSGVTLDKDKLAISFLAGDGFGYSSSYYKLVNKEGQSDLLYNDNLNESNMKTGDPVDAVLALELTNSVPVTDAEFSTEKSNDKTPRLYTGVDKDTKDFGSIANFGYASPSNVANITFKDHFEVKLQGGVETLRTSDSVYIKDGEDNTIKIMNSSQVIKPGTKVEFRTTRMTTPNVNTKVLNRGDESQAVPVVKSEDGIYSFTMPDRDVEISLEKAEHGAPYMYVRMEYPKKVDETIEYDLNLREFNSKDYPENNFATPVLKGGISAIMVNIYYDTDKFEYLAPKLYGDDVFDMGDSRSFTHETTHGDRANLMLSSHENKKTTGLLSTGRFKNKTNSDDFSSIVFNYSQQNARSFDVGLEDVDSVPFNVEKDNGEVELEFNTIYEADDSMLAGETKVSQEGVKGTGNLITSKYCDDDLIVDHNYDETIEISKAPVNKIIKYGTKAPKPIVKENTDIEKLPSAEYINNIDNDKKTIDVYKVKEDGKTVTDADIESGIKSTDGSEQTYKSTDLKTLKVTSEDKSKTADYTINLIDREQEAPKNLKSVAVSKKGADDGKITGVTDKMEYRVKGTDAWTDISGTEVTGLKPGTYEVRYKAVTGYKASPSVEAAVADAPTIDNTDIQKSPDSDDISSIDNTGKKVKVHKVKADGTPVSDNDILSGIISSDGTNQSYEIDGDKLKVKSEDGTKTETYDIEFVNRSQEAPKNLKSQPVSESGKEDGKITGVDSSMEYRLNGSEDWTDIDGNTIEGLKEGTYEVRRKAKDGFDASKPTTVRVGRKSSGGGETITQPDKPETPKPEKPNVPSDQLKLEGPYIKGYPDNTFGPDKSITRGEAAAMLARILSKNAELNKEADKYPDVTDGWYREAVDYMTKNGYMKGYPEGDFKPDNPMTRAEFAEMIKGINKEEKFGRIDFPDVASDHWASEAIHLATSRGLVKGYPDGTFGSENKITRSEVVLILNRLFDIEATDKEKEDLIKNADNPFKDLKTDHWGYADILIASTNYKLKK